LISRNEVYESKIIREEYRCKAITEFLSICRGTQEFPGIVFTRQKKHAKILAEKIGAKIGIEVPVITAQVNKEIRSNTVKRMADRDPTMPFVVATGVWKTGINITSLRFVMLVDSGQAPIGLLQAAGRATRRADDKQVFRIYDLQDWGCNERYDEYNRLREQHCIRAGFTIGMPVDITDLGLPKATDKTAAELAEEAIRKKLGVSSQRSLLDELYAPKPQVEEVEASREMTTLEWIFEDFTFRDFLRIMVILASFAAVVYFTQVVFK
jgi:superfamily II DNA or RNA helicase